MAADVHLKTVILVVGKRGEGMPSKEEVQRRKELTRAIAQKQRAAEEARMPISKKDLKDLFAFLDASFEERECSHSLELTRAFLTSRKLDEKTIIPWLGEYGGFCDCEVLGNVEESWSE